MRTGNIWKITDWTVDRGFAGRTGFGIGMDMRGGKASKQKMIRK